jgi:hypothetical protein
MRTVELAQRSGKGEWRLAKRRMVDPEALVPPSGVREQQAEGQERSNGTNR